MRKLFGGAALLALVASLLFTSGGGVQAADHLEAPFVQ